MCTVIVQAASDTQDAPPTAGISWLRKLGNAALDLLFPPTCVGCQRYGAWLCQECVSQIERIQPPVCAVCGWPGDRSTPGSGAAHHHYRGGVCCQSALANLDGLRAFAFHSGSLREAIHQLKYDDLRALAVPLGKLMAVGWTALAPENSDFDAIVPIPLHRTRQRQRGYNQSALLARELARHLQRPVIEDSLVRIRATAPQVDLNAQARQENVRDAFRCVGHNLTGKRVLLIDDVCTTGATLEAASTALRAGGASSVWAYTLARARGQSRPVS